MSATSTNDTVADQFLYGLPGDERAWHDPAGVYESCLAPFPDEDPPAPGESRTIEKWTVAPAASYLPDPEDTAEMVAEVAGQEMSEGAWEQWDAARKDPDVVAAYRAANELLASKVSWLMCGELVGTHTVTWAEDGSPLLDGQPMHVKGSAA